MTNTPVITNDNPNLKTATRVTLRDIARGTTAAYGAPYGVDDNAAEIIRRAATTALGIGQLLAERYVEIPVDVVIASAEYQIRTRLGLDTTTDLATMTLGQLTRVNQGDLNAVRMFLTNVAHMV